jgi:hypothetical protein
VEHGYGDDVYEADYLLPFLAADLRMDPALRPRPVSSVAFGYVGNTYIYYLFNLAYRPSAMMAM